LSVAALVGGVDLFELGFQGLELALEAAELGLEGLAFLDKLAFWWASAFAAAAAAAAVAACAVAA